MIIHINQIKITIANATVNERGSSEWNLPAAPVAGFGFNSVAALA